jgi:hypothetical protein
MDAFERQGRAGPKCKMPRTPEYCGPDSSAVHTLRNLARGANNACIIFTILAQGASRRVTGSKPWLSNQRRSDLQGMVEAWQVLDSSCRGDSGDMGLYP